MDRLLAHTTRGEDAVYMFLRYLLNEEIEMREDMVNKRPLVMTNEDWQKYSNAANVTFVTKACRKTSISTLWRFMILIQENTAAKATEDATTRQQKIDMRLVKLKNRKTPSINGSQ